jgi:hypothetical protein
MKGISGTIEKGCKMFIPYSAIVCVHIVPEKRIAEVITGGIRGLYTPPKIKNEETGKFILVVTGIGGHNINFVYENIETAVKTFNDIIEEILQETQE